MAAPLPRFTIEFTGDTPTADLLRLCAGAIPFTAEFLRQPFVIKDGHDSELTLSGTAAAGLADLLTAVEQTLWFLVAVEDPPDRPHPPHPTKE
jgi:hypothetical protein